MVEEIFISIYQMLFVPSTYLISLKERVQQPNFRKLYLWLIGVVSFLFALFVSNYGYSSGVWYIGSSNPFYPYRDIINGSSLFIIGLVFFAFWTGIDFKFVKKALNREDFMIQKGVIMTMNVPWLVLIPYLNIMRLLWSGTYFPWGYVWIAFIHIFLVLTWRYWLFFKAIIIYAKNNASMVLLNLLIVVSLIIFALIIGPLIFGGNISVLLSQLF